MKKLDKKYLKELSEYFGGKLPDPTHYPKQFQFKMEIFNHHKRMKDRKAKSTAVSTVDIKV